MLTVQPFDPSSIKEIERAILEFEDLRLTPSNNREVVHATPSSPKAGASASRWCARSPRMAVSRSETSSGAPTST